MFLNNRKWSRTQPGLLLLTLVCLASEDAPSSVDKEEEETTEAKEDESETKVSSVKEEPGVAEDKVMTEGEPTEEGKEAPTEGEQKEAATKEEGKPEEEKKETEGDESSNLFRIDSGLLPFPEKLMALLDGNKVSDAMWWLPDGDAFCLIPVVFAEKVLDRHFQGTKFESFTRKLNRWYVFYIPGICNVVGCVSWLFSYCTSFVLPCCCFCVCTTFTGALNVSPAKRYRQIPLRTTTSTLSAASPSSSRT